jgi:hypothetical protein
MAEENNRKGPLSEPVSVGSDGMLPWLVCPRNKGEFEVLMLNLGRLLHEMFTKFQSISAEMKVRMQRPRGDSAMARLMAAARIDMRIHAAFIVKPWAMAAASLMTTQKAINMVHARFMAFYAEAAAKARRNSAGSGRGFGY